VGTITIIIVYMVIAGYQFKGGGRDRSCSASSRGLLSM
jgi:hypothetical protein